MSKVLGAFLISTLISIILVTGLFLFFNYNGAANLATDFVALVSKEVYWIGLVIFSFLFFVFFSLPLTLLIIKE